MRDSRLRPSVRAEYLCRGHRRGRPLLLPCFRRCPLVLAQFRLQFLGMRDVRKGDHHAVNHVVERIAGQHGHVNFDTIPWVIYTSPEIAWVGLTEDDAKKQGIAVTKGLFPWAASGRAIANGRDEGFTKLLFDASSHKILGGGIVGTHAGDLISEVALAIEMGADMVDIGKTIHPHPTLGESIGLAAEASEGHCTDLPPVRKK